MNTQNLQQSADKFLSMALEYAPRLVLALLTLIVGFWLINRFTRVTSSLMERKDIDASLRTFLASLLRITLKILLIVSIAQMIGIETTSFIAILGAAGLAVGLALQGSLANFAGGVLILIFKPFRVGDFIETQGLVGTVSSINILNTILTTPENNTAIIPNGALANDKVINYTKLPPRRVDLVVGISYGSDIDKAKSVIMDVMNNHELVLSDPAPFVGVLGLGDSSVDLAVRPHCDAAHYWDVYFSVYELVKKALDANGIEIPFPQRDIHMRSQV